ncbi:MAG: hypothetical protein JSR34_06940 [Proteobacteria bacterium]|nr:hypothetical protein [Pseudomonadota bacterium]
MRFMGFSGVVGWTPARSAPDVVSVGIATAPSHRAIAWTRVGLRLDSVSDFSYTPIAAG